MTRTLQEFANRAIQRGWLVRPRAQPAVVPRPCAERFPWLPDSLNELICGFDAVVSPDQNAWFVTCVEISGDSGSAFSWNQWEMDSLDAAMGDQRLEAAIRAFWDEHFPLLLSVKSGYAYVAIRRDLKIVAGEEPEYEEVGMITDGFESFLELIVAGDHQLDLLV